MAKYELLLSETELQTFEKLFAAKKFDVDNPPYQAWLVPTLASLPMGEREAVGQILSVLCCTVLHCGIMMQVFSSHISYNVPKRKRNTRYALTYGAPRYLTNSPEYPEILTERASKQVVKKANKALKKPTAVSKSTGQAANKAAVRKSARK